MHPQQEDNAPQSVVVYRWSVRSRCSWSKMTGGWKGSTSRDMNQTTMSTYLKHQPPSAGYHCNFSPLLLVIWNPANRSCCQWGVG